MNNLRSILKSEVMNVMVSSVVRKKAVQLHKFQKYSTAKGAWGKDQKLLRYNLLLVPDAKNYTVLLALGKNSR